jgi:hypothetical protein
VLELREQYVATFGVACVVGCSRLSRIGGWGHR